MRLDGPPAHICWVCNRHRSTWTYQDQDYCDMINSFAERFPEHASKMADMPHLEPGWIPYLYMTGCGREGCPAMDNRYDEMELKPAPTETEEEYYKKRDKNAHHRTISGNST